MQSLEFRQSSFRDFLHVIFKRKKQILLFFAVTVCTVVIGTFVSLMQSALTPLKPISPKVLLNIMLAIFLGGFGGLGLAFFLEYLDDSLEKPEDVEKELQLPVLTSIPELTDIDKLKVGGYRRRKFSLRPNVAESEVP